MEWWPYEKIFWQLQVCSGDPMERYFDSCKYVVVTMEIYSDCYKYVVVTLWKDILIDTRM